MDRTGADKKRKEMLIRESVEREKLPPEPGKGKMDWRGWEIREVTITEP